MTEIWKDIPGFVGLYQVSNLGNVRSLPRRTTKGKVLKASEDKDGYLKITLSNGLIKEGWLVHRLVASAFVQNPLGLPVVNHIDENKQNNRADNLEYCTALYNTRYNGMPERRGLSQRRPINQYTLSGVLLRRWTGRVEIENALGVAGGNITSACQGKRKTAYGYIWRYADG